MADFHLNLLSKIGKNDKRRGRGLNLYIAQKRISKRHNAREHVKNLDHFTLVAVCLHMLTIHCEVECTSQVTVKVQIPLGGAVSAPRWPK